MPSPFENQVFDIMNNPETALLLENLRFRWSHEKEYEDWADYEQHMREKITVEGILFIKATKRPFGFILQAGRSKAHVFLKTTDRRVSIFAKLNE